MKRFWKKVDVKSPDECWEWKAGLNSKGYGNLKHEGKSQLAHRVSYQLKHGAIPKGDGYHGMCVLHKCDNPLCVNPNHLFLGTQKDNMTDMNKKERSGLTKLREVDVINIRAIYEHTSATYQKLADIYSITNSAIGEIIRRKTWVHVP